MFYRESNLIEVFVDEFFDEQAKIKTFYLTSQILLLLSTLIDVI